MPFKKRNKTLSEKSSGGVSGQNAIHKETKSHDHFRVQVIVPFKDKVKSCEELWSQDCATKYS